MKSIALDKDSLLELLKYELISTGIIDSKPSVLIIDRNHPDHNYTIDKDSLIIISAVKEETKDEETKAQFDYEDIHNAAQ